MARIGLYISAIEDAGIEILGLQFDGKHLALQCDDRDQEKAEEVYRKLFAQVEEAERIMEVEHA